jgi:hypothetical protein
MGKKQIILVKKGLIYLTFLLFLFTVCSGCVKKLENCKILPKIELESGKNDESSDKKVDTEDKIKNLIENRTTSAEATCNF